MTLKEQADIHYKAGNYEEAIPFYRAAVEIAPSDHYAWGQLVLSLGYTNEHEAAVEAGKSALHSHPRSAWLWRQLGNELFKLDRLGEAEKALDQSRRIDPEAEWLWRYYAQLYKKQEKHTEEAKALEELVELEKATSRDVNQIGIAHHSAKNYGKALAYYSMAARMEPDAAWYYNMGLVFNDAEVSQDADAADAYRRALRVSPTYAKAQEQLDATKSKLSPLAERALTQAKEVVRSDERYQHYLNPFEVLQIEMDTEVTDAKAIPKSKKRLLQELDLNDGKVSWLNEQPLDRSRVLAIEDELDDVDRQHYHRLVAQNEPLLRFLTHGDIRHFLYSDDYFPEEALELLDEDDGFRTFLSKPFAAQYNAVLSRAIDKKALTVVEVLFDGRRWVEDADLDLCLNSAFKKVGHLVDIMSELEKESDQRLVGSAEVQNALEVHGMVGLFNLLPAQFRAQQTQIVACLRSLAINCHNKHGQTEMSKNILLLCKKFQFKSHALNERLKEDYDKIEELLSEQRQAQLVSPRPPQSSPSRQATQSVTQGRASHNSKSNTCFFCDRVEASQEAELRQPAYREISRSHFPRSVQFSRAEIGIARCITCKATHDKASMMFWVPAVLVVGTCVLLSFVGNGFFIAAIVFAIAFAALKGMILKSVAANDGTRPATKNVIAQHPVLKAGISQGWSLHKPSA